MSIDAMNWAWQVKCRSAAEKLVLMALADNADNDGYCWPGNAKTAERCQMSESSVRRHIVALERAGLIEKVKRRRRKDGTLSVWIYRLTLSKAQDSATAHPQPVGTGAQKSDHICTEICAPVNAQEPSVEPSLNPQLTHVSDITQEAEILDDSESLFITFWRDYPRSEGKQPARRAWAKLSEIEQRAAVEAVPVHVEHWRRDKTERKFIPHAATWLNARRWEDEFDTDYQPDGSLATRVAQHALNKQRQERYDRGRSSDSPRELDSGDDWLE